ncbi:helix-turn-helix domain-containing protein [Providencia huaxiensis]|uniref:helix-turn-helix domain-containing protein n=1 Tax=Providencia TaxID=586 RepID=UPI00234986D2|nr:helix-turn-helix transcriptional regulator [Providencia sp. PROV076]
MNIRKNTLSRSIGLFLKAARKDKNLTGKELAKLIHVSQQQVSRYELGNTPITLEQLEKYLIVLDKKWSDLLKYIERESRMKNMIDSINIYDEHKIDNGSHKNKI